MRQLTWAHKLGFLDSIDLAECHTIPVTMSAQRAVGRVVRGVKRVKATGEDVVRSWSLERVIVR